MSTVSVRLDYGARAFEVSGTKEQVDEYLNRYSELLAFFRSQGSAAVSVRDVLQTPSQALSSTEIPSEFGEYFHQFGYHITDVDRVLVAGHFVQVNGGGGVFTTRDANDLLINQNVKVANASECVRRALATRRVFSVEKGAYKVSSQGIDYLRTLRLQSEA